MPTVSKRGNMMPASPIRRLVPYAEAAKERGIKVYHLNIGQPDIKTPEVAIKAIHDANLKVVEYSHSAGFLSYRKKLAASYRAIGIDVDHTEILITTGGSEAFTFAFLCCFDPGDEIIIPEPFYANYNAFAAMAGLNVKTLSANIENGFALPPIEEFEKLIGPKTRGIVICNPNNPTGYLYSKDELEKLRDLVAKYDLFYFSDEVYREFCYDGKKHISAMLLKGIEKNVIMVDSVSKRYSECGVRIGALVTKNREVLENALKYGQSRLSPPTFGQIAAEASLETPQDYFDEVYKEYTARRNFLVEGLNKIPGVYCPMPQGSFYTVARLPVDDSDKFCQWILSEFEYKNQTVMMAPATGFYYTLSKGKNEVRIAYVLNRDDLANALEVLRKALEVYPGRTI
ncbi:MAG: pyridoxal phosphate-dependent aminotransferase [Marinilabiliaceae bacterium]|nr:pyridoxal phosphate-dependent aminotransferase [Marinilabiliaceae bacterium]